MTSTINIGGKIEWVNSQGVLWSSSEIVYTNSVHIPLFRKQSPGPNLTVREDGKSIF